VLIGADFKSKTAWPASGLQLPGCQATSEKVCCQEQASVASKLKIVDSHTCSEDRNISPTFFSMAAQDPNALALVYNDPSNMQLTGTSASTSNALTIPSTHPSLRASSANPNTGLKNVPAFLNKLYRCGWSSPVWLSVLIDRADLLCFASIQTQHGQ
jgi:hypothetical protein